MDRRERSHFLWRKNASFSLTSSCSLVPDEPQLFDCLGLFWQPFINRPFFFHRSPSHIFLFFQTCKKQALHYTLEILWQGIENSTSLQETFISLAFNLLNHNSVKRLACLDWLCCSSAAHKSFWGCVVDCPPVSLQQETTVTRRTLCSGRCHKLLTSTDSSGAHFCVATEIWWGGRRWHWS